VLSVIADPLVFAPALEPSRVGVMEARPRRSCTLAAERTDATTSTVSEGIEVHASRPRPTGRVLIIHANAKPYGMGPSQSCQSDETAIGTAAIKAKASNRNFNFQCADYEAMRDSGKPYSGDPRQNKLLPLPRPTYTEFINRAKRARMLERLDFLFCSAEAPRQPRIDPSHYEVVVWCGVSFRRFTKLWTPERTHFFPAAFQARALATLCCAHRLRQQPPKGTTATLGDLPLDLIIHIISQSAEKHERAKEDYDSLQTICSGARHVFLPAPGSSGLRDNLYDAVFGL
jgi:hypothetical protein